jgi:hypothetical protein
MAESTLLQTGPEEGRRLPAAKSSEGKAQDGGSIYPLRGGVSNEQRQERGEVNMPKQGMWGGGMLE